MKFSDIKGHKKVVESLRKTLNSGDIAHAYIFEGPKGVGKRTAARIFASAVLCDSDNKPCGNCQSCLLLNTNSHPDLKIITPESSITVDEVRNIVKDVNVRPYYGGRKVYIIEDSDKMTPQAQNSLLKTLEEPPEYAVIILTAQSTDMLLPTIISRGIIKKFYKNSMQEIEEYVLEKYSESKDRAKIIASLCDGVIGKVEQIIGSDSFNKVRETTLNILDRIAAGDKNSVLDWTKFFKDNKNDIDLILHLMLLWSRDILVLKETGNNSLIINVNAEDKLHRIAQTISIQRSIQWVKSVADTMQKLKSNANFDLTIETMLLRLSE